MIENGEPQLRNVKLEAPETEVLIESLSTGLNHACATYRIPLTAQESQQKTKCWGLNDGSGKWGSGSKIYSAGQSKDSMGVNLPVVLHGLGEVVQVSTYASHSCALSRRGEVKCWGSNSDGMLGLGDQISRGRDAIDLGEHLPPVRLGLPARALSPGGSRTHRTCVLLINHTVKCWGDNSREVLGYEDSISRGSSPDDMGENLPFVSFN